MTNAPIFDLSGRTVLITGASSGLGAHFARVLAQAGASVALAARRTDRLEALCAELAASGTRCVAVPMDVGDAASVAAGFAAAQAALGPVDTVIANAGVASETGSIDMPVGDVDALVNINLRGIFLTAQAGAQQMIAAGSKETGRGRIILIGSITADKIWAGTALYGATKAAVRHLGRSLAREWARRGINVNIIQPGYFATEMTSDTLDSDSGKYLVNSFPRKRMRPLDDLTAPLLLLASDASEGLTGVVISVDDGQSL